MPEVVAAHQKFGSRGFRVVGISVDDAGKAQKLAEIVERLGVTWPTIYTGEGFKGDGPLTVRNRVTGVPTTFLLDRRGVSRYSDLHGDELVQRIGELLDERDAARRERR